MGKFEDSPLGQLAKLLDEGGFQVTITGWKAELEATEQKLKIAVEALEEIAALGVYVCDDEGLGAECKAVQIAIDANKKLHNE